MKTCFLHVGPHKTGSSSIQKFLRANQSVLRANNLQCISLIGSRKMPSRLFFPKQRDSLMSGRGKGIVWKSIRQYLEDDCSLILSDERLSRQLSDPDFLPSLVRLFSKFGFRLVLVSVHREQASHLNSSYVQGVKRFLVKEDIDSYVASHLSDLRYSHRQMKMLADTAGVEHRLMSFEQALKHSTLGNAFVRTLGVDPAAFDDHEIKPLNPNPGTLTVVAAERIRSIHPQVQSAREDNDAYKAFYRYFTKIGWEKDPYFGIGEALQKEIYDQFFEENDSFARSTLGMGWEEIAPFRARPVNVRSYERLSAREREEVDVIVDKIVREFRKARRRPVVDDGDAFEVFN